MKNRAFYLVAAYLVAVQLACAVPVGTALPPSPTATVTRTPKASVTAEDVTIAIVRQPTVNVRDAAGGDPTGEYVTAGQEVTVLEVEGDWVRIADPAGWIFIGCLRDLSEKGCTAK
jgi:hypothetical protein